MGLLLRAERLCLIGHLVAMAFGLAGLLLVMPNPEFLNYVPAGQIAFRWSLAGGGVAYILLGTIAVSLYGYRTLGLRALLAFLIPAIALSLTSELVGTATGFPFGNYSYLNGLGFKVLGRVPFTIPLSWFYLGLSSYLLARAGFSPRHSLSDQPLSDQHNKWISNIFRNIAAIGLGAILLTSWDFVLDPAMSQTAMPFWYWHEPGAFYGMPYQNFGGWMLTGASFMTIAALLWNFQSKQPQRIPLNVPLITYIGNFIFAMVMSMAAGFWVPIGLGILLGVVPAILCWKQSQVSSEQSPLSSMSSPSSEQETSDVSAPIGVSAK